MDVQRKLEILADAAKYDASCASRGTEQRDSRDGKGIGSTDAGMGICHSYAPDGRCIALSTRSWHGRCGTADRFPLDVASASREDMRAPGFGVRAVDRIIAARRVAPICSADLARLHIPRNKALPFIVLSDHRPSPISSLRSSQ
jgi:predicted DNA-binding helix-hairpin-helix protein